MYGVNEVGKIGKKLKTTMLEILVHTDFRADFTQIFLRQICVKIRVKSA